VATERTAAVIVIGNEILSGKVQESNATFLIHELRELGVSLREIHVVPDELPVIASAVAAACGRFDHVFTTGGVGPTHDDVTIPAIAQGLGLELELSQDMAAVVHHFYGDDANAHLMRMAHHPRGSTLLWDNGLQFPVLVVRNIYVFPGDPAYFRKKWLAIRHRFRTEPFHIRRIFTCCGEGEIADLLEQTERCFPGVHIGSYPVYGNPEYEVQLTIESKEPDLADQATAQLRQGLSTGKIVREE
jgi:molybdenum cofactor synthesis domain-containing protein